MDFAEILRNVNFWLNHNWSPVVKSEGGACLSPLQALYSTAYEKEYLVMPYLVSSAASNYRHFVETHIGLGGWRCSSVVVCLSSKLKPLGSIPRTAPPQKNLPNQNRHYWHK